MIEDELRQIILSIPNIRWLRFVTIDGLVHPTFMYDADGHRRNTDLDREEDQEGPYTSAILSFSERILDELALSPSRSVVLSGGSGTCFMLSVGDGNKWVMSFVVNGHPSVDETLKYFQDRDYLVNLVPFLNRA